MDYSRKEILVTGASSEIGAVTALLLAEHDNQIVITARRDER